MRWSRHRTDLREVVNALGYAVLVGEASGRILHETPAFAALLEAGDEADAVRASATALLATIGAERCQPAGGGAEGAKESVWSEVRTRNGRYLLRASRYGGLGDGPPPLVLVLVERATMATPSEADLRQTFSLTRTEVRVARLLAAGLTNAQVAVELQISPHTARRHTERVLFKMGVRSRAEVAARLFF